MKYGYGLPVSLPMAQFIHRPRSTKHLVGGKQQEPWRAAAMKTLLIKLGKFLLEIWRDESGAPSARKSGDRR